MSSASLPGGREIEARSLEALASLLRTLDGSADLGAVAERALLTLAGQLLVRRAAFYVADDAGYSLRARVGVGPNRELPEVWSVPDEILAALDTSDSGVLEVEALSAHLDSFVGHSFDRIARLSDGDRTVGAVLLGGALHSRAMQDPDFQLLRTMGIVIGTTVHRVRVQEELRESNRRLAQAELIRTSVMDHVSHEFNTPLMVLKSVGDLLAETEGEERDELLAMHGEAVARLEELVQSILRIARESQQEGAMRSLRCEDAVTRVVAPWFDKLAGAKGIWSHGRFPETGLVQIDLNRVETILDALHTNAVEAGATEPLQVNAYSTDSDGWNDSILLERLNAHADRPDSPPDFPDPPRDAGLFVVEVVDLGRGIPESDLERVFEPFSQATNSTSLGVAGSGMGLPTARRLAEELGGRVELWSREGTGTLAALILPIEPGEA